MAAKFNGFTQEEINRVNGKPKKVQVMSRGIRRMPELKPATTERLHKDLVDKGPNLLPKSSVPAKPKPDVEISLGTDIESTIASMQDVLHFKPLSAKNANNVPHEQQPVDESILHLSEINGNHGAIPKRRDSATRKNSHQEQQDEVATPFKGLSLQEFQNQQKMIKEQNKQKKELLHKAIEHHSQKTVAEIQKIESIRGELGKLDSDLATDVAILRKKIEDATIEYSKIRKSYEKIEAEFLKMKMELHQAGEKKELLTEHLCTVIAHNEDRKAKKLTELMEKLGLCPVDDPEVSNSDASDD